MDKHIVANIQPFIIQQEVCVYEDGECVEVTKCKLTDIEDNILTLSQEYDVKEVDLGGGNNPYSLKIKEDLTSTKYSKYKFNINIY